MNLVHGMSGMMGGCGLLPGPCATPEQSIVNSTDPFGDGSLVAKYLLDGDATDLCGNYDGAENGGVSYDIGRFDQCLSFDDDGENVSFTTPIMSECTYSTWSYNSYGGVETVYFIEDADNRGVIVALKDATTLQNGSIKIDGSWVEGDDITIDDITDTWVNVVTSIVGDTKHTYINGKLVNVTSNNLVPNRLINPDCFIGDSEYIDGDGLIDQVEIYNRALNPQEVQILYTQSKYCSDPTQAISGLVAHYPLDGTAEDLTGNYNGTENGVTYVESEMGIAGSFGTSDDHTKITIDIPTSGLQEITISFLAKPNSTEICALGNSEGSSIFEIRTNGLYDNDMIGDDVRCWDKSQIDIEDNSWSHIVMVYKSGDNSITINNEVVASNTTEFTEIFSNINKIGQAYSGNDDYYMDGQIKNVRIYNRALTAEEIKTIYDYEKITRNIVIDRGLVAYYPLKNSSEDHWVSQYDGADNGDVSYDGQSASFDGDGDYVGTGFDGLKLDESYSASCWVNSIDVDNSASFLGTTRNGSRGGFVLESSERDEPGRCKVIITDTDSSAVISDDSATNITDGNWYCIAYTWDASNKVGNVFINTVKEITVTTDSVYDQSDTEWRVVTNGTNFAGNVSNFRLYNRLLSQEEITTIYETEKKEFE